MPRETPRFIWRTGLAFAVGLLLVALLLARVGVDEVARALVDAEPSFVLLSGCAYAAFFALRGVRWKVLLARTIPGVSVVATTGLSAFGWLVSTFIPMKAGDVARATLLARRERANLASVAGSVAVERGLDVLGLASMASLGLLVAAVWGGHHLQATVAEAVAVAWIAPLVALVALYAFAGYFQRRRDGNLAFRIAARFLDAVEELRRSPGRIVPLLLLTLAIAAAQVAVFAMLFLAFDPAAPLALVLGGAPLFLLSFIIAVAPGNVGTYEAAFVLVFSLFGFEPDTLIAMALAIHLITMSTVTLLGGAGFAAERLAHPQGAAASALMAVPR